MRLGVFDSGVGGFTVVRPLLERYPFVSIIYVADTAHVPYSTKTPKELQTIILKILHFFLLQKVDAVVFACNTSSALVLPNIRPFAFVPFFGVVEPGVKGALQVTKGKGIGVAANAVTAKSGVFKAMILQEKMGVPVIEKACGELVPFVEKEDLDSQEVVNAVEKCCIPFQGKIDTLIFGCTHFPFLKSHFSFFLPNVQFVDPALVLVEDMASLFKKETFPATVGEHELWATRLSPHVEAWAKKVLGWKLKAKFLDLDSLEPWNPASVPVPAKKLV
jgi:glutamate racemase